MTRFRIRAERVQPLILIEDALAAVLLALHHTGRLAVKGTG